MRLTGRLLASAKARFLEAGAPTGLTGLYTHANPRPALMLLYAQTLAKLGELPAESVYRRSTEALTKLRLDVVSKTRPEGYEAWQREARQIVAEHADVFDTPAGRVPYGGGKYLKHDIGGRQFVSTRHGRAHDDLVDEWDGEEQDGEELEGTRTEAERRGQAALGRERPGEDEKEVRLGAEPPLSAAQ
jgi:NADH dehydrogenase (ubiquinone) 1 alpha subcomplex subunit 5